MNLPALPLSRTLLSTALAIALAACGERSDAGAQSAGTRIAPGETALAAAQARDEAALVDEIAANLQACSYDGTAVAFSPARMKLGVNADGAQVVAEIMKFTGLPQNFEVGEHPEVPNAAAVVLLGPDKLPRRVIAYNPDFINLVRRATRDNEWAPISIMAHEIGHHLSGHTIQPGGSQPPSELEADKFSGFVLYNMGALLVDAQSAMNALVPEGDGRTHPGRGKRVRAIEDGWMQACAQQSDDCDGMNSTAATAATETKSAPLSTGIASAPGRERAPATARMPVATASSAPPPTSVAEAVATTAPTTRASVSLDRLPVAAPDAIPSKFDRFVHDEIGLLDPATRARFEQTMYDHARTHGIEIVSLLVDDLDGLDADAYAYAMMRQLRVGKLDVGNGVVLVVAPRQGTVGVAMGPGVMLEMKDYLALEKRRLGSFLEGSRSCGDTCGTSWSEAFFEAAEHIRADTDGDWTIRFPSLDAMLATYAQTLDARAASDMRYDPSNDPTARRIVRIEATVVNLDAPSGDKTAWVNDVRKRSVGRAVHVRSADGRNIVLYVDPHTEHLMTAGALQVGRRYAFIAREESLSRNPKDSLSFSLLSYDLRD